MRLLVGLGNPGDEYAHTRHNLGFVVLDRVAEQISGVSWRRVEDGFLAEVNLPEKHFLFKPSTYMNRSGQAVRRIMDYYRIAASDTCIVADDVYLEPGTVRVRQEGGAGGHNGWKSIIEHLDNQEYWRVKIGAGVYAQKPEERHVHPPLEDYVLQKMPLHDQKRAQGAIDRLVPDLIEWLRSGEKLQEETVHTQ